MRHFILIIILSLGSLAMMGQSASQADNLFKAADYTAARSEYGKLLKKYPTNSLYLYRYARCAQELGDVPTAIQYFTKSGDRYILTCFFLGELYYSQWQMEQAIASYQRYLEEADDDQRMAQAQQQIVKAQRIQKYLRHVQQISVIQQDTLPKATFLQAYAPYREAGTWEQDSLGNVTFTTARADRRFCTIGTDSLHLVQQYRLLDQFSDADTLPKVINFTQKQNYPFMFSDGVTLYFAAQDSNGIGGYDIYVTRYNSALEQYTTPENIGFPFNSERNDYLLVIDETSHKGLFASDRYCSDDSVIVYTYSLPNEKTYWHHIDLDSIVGYARLQLGTTLSVIQQPQSVVLEDSIEMVPEQTIWFVLNDSTVYTSEDHFLNDTALEKYHLYVERQHELEQVVEQLDAQRQQWQMEDETTRQLLTPSILQLENKRGQIQQEILELLQRIIHLEAREYER